jgi:hypothetical protein
MHWIIIAIAMRWTILPNCDDRKKMVVSRVISFQETEKEVWFQANMISQNTTIKLVTDTDNMIYSLPQLYSITSVGVYWMFISTFTPTCLRLIRFIVVLLSLLLPAEEILKVGCHVHAYEKYSFSPGPSLSCVQVELPRQILDVTNLSARFSYYKQLHKGGRFSQDPIKK